MQMTNQMTTNLGRLNELLRVLSAIRGGKDLKALTLAKGIGPQAGRYLMPTLPAEG